MNKIIVSDQNPLPSLEALYTAINAGLELSDVDTKIIDVCMKIVIPFKAAHDQVPTAELQQEIIKDLCGNAKLLLHKIVSFKPIDGNPKKLEVIPHGLLALGKCAGWVSVDDLKDLKRRMEEQRQFMNAPILPIHPVPREIPIPAREALTPADQEILDDIKITIPKREETDYAQRMLALRAQMPDFCNFMVRYSETGDALSQVSLLPLGHVALKECGELTAEDKNALYEKVNAFVQKNIFDPRSALLDLNKAKVHPDALQATSADNVGDFQDRFEISLEPFHKMIPLQAWTNRFTVPHIGVYGNHGVVFEVAGQKFDYYQWSPPIIAARLPNAVTWEKLPAPLKASLEQQGCTASFVANAPHSVECYLNISGNPFYQMGTAGKTEHSPKGYNISFHSAIFPIDTKGQDAMPLVGIFEPEGVASIDISINKLELRHCSLHADASHASSPDNIKFNPTSPAAVFWSLGIHDNKIVITQHIMLNEDALETRVRHASRQSRNLKELLNNLQETILPPNVWIRLARLLSS